MSDYKGELHSQGVFGSRVSEIPGSISACPECGGKLFAEAIDHIIESGAPTTGGLNVGCIADDDVMMHRYWQSDWQPVVDAVAKWCGAEEV